MTIRPRPGHHRADDLAHRAVDGLRRVIAIEMLAAARALDLRAPLAAGPVTGAVREVLRTVVPGPGPDRHRAPEIEAVVALLSSGTILAAGSPAAPGPVR